jgi:1-acyl-sn-glycerol-3-phosphate acyltransferase
MLLLLRSFVFTLVAFGSVFTAAAFLLLTFWMPRRFHKWLCLTWCRFAVWVAGPICNIRVEIEGRENIPDEPCVVMLKHSSTFETYWHVTLFPKTVWVLKKEMMSFPLIGWAISVALDPIAIDRKSGASAVKQVIRQGKERLDNGAWVTVFPEGTRMPAGETRKYGISGAALAREANVKILPVAHNAGDFWGKLSRVRRTGVIRVRVGPPIDASVLPPKETNLVVQQWIETQMHEISIEYQKKYVQPAPD